MESTIVAANLIETIMARKSVRAFCPDPVSQETVRSILELAQRAPSWSNTQPWEVAVVTGRKLAALKDVLASAMLNGVEPKPDVSISKWDGEYRARRRENGIRIYGLLGITREEQEKKTSYELGMITFFGAPTALVLILDRAVLPVSLIDLGAFAQTAMLAAQGFGLGTCPLAKIAQYPDVVRDALGLAESKCVLFGMGIGHEDKEAVVNSHHSNRVPLEDFVTWYD